MNPQNKNFRPRLIAWEITRRCHLKCKHCRASAEDESYENEFSTEEIKKTLVNIASFSKPIIILTGGEPMMRDDIYEIAAFGNSLGLRMVMAPCGKLVDSESIRKMKEAGIQRISLSIDGASKKTHDNFRGQVGSFEDAIHAAEVARDGGMPFQINTTVTKSNLPELGEIFNLVQKLGAVSFHPFLLVPTGRGKDLAGLELTPEEYEETLKKISEWAKNSSLDVKPTCAPHYFRIKGRDSKATKISHGHGGMYHATRGCLGGTGFAFISHRGIVQICGFLDVPCGDVRKSNYDFRHIWETSDIFLKMRDKNAYKGKCGICEFHDVCGGCRARAYAATGDFMKPEPYCIYIPQRQNKDVQKKTDEEILTALQDEFPITPEPFAEIASRFGINEDELLNKIVGWKESGLIRRLSANISDRAIGFSGALVAMACAEDQIDKLDKVIASHPGVSHSYLRAHHYNVWFTIKVPIDMNIAEHVGQIAKEAGAGDYLILPSIKTYKLNVRFDATKTSGACGKKSDQRACKVMELSPQVEAILMALNDGLTPVKHPFAQLAESLGISEEKVLSEIGRLKDNGVIAKFRFVLNHMKLGLSANAMVVWDIDEEKRDAAGRIFAAKEFISHCYSRVRSEKFPYSVYTMIHADSPETLKGCIDKMKEEVLPRAFCVLKTMKELLKKKSSLLRKDYELWSDARRT